MASRLYVGSRKGDHKYEVFRSEVNPTEKTHGKKYSFVIGPFRTRKGADFMAKYGKGNPHVQHVADAERLANEKTAQRKNPAQSLTVRKTMQGYEVSAMIKGYRVHTHYIGYTKKEAVADFRNQHSSRRNPRYETRASYYTKGTDRNMGWSYVNRGTIMQLVSWLESGNSLKIGNMRYTKGDIHRLKRMV